MKWVWVCVMSRGIEITVAASCSQRRCGVALSCINEIATPRAFITNGYDYMES